MNPLSLLNGSARASGMKDADSYGAREDSAAEPSAQDSAFARMLNAPSAPDPATQPKPKAPAPASRRDASNQPGEDEGQAKDTAAKTEGREEASSRTERTPAAKPPGKQPGKQADASADSEASEPAAAATSDGREATNSSDDTAGTWPPPGLGGFGLMLLQPAAPAAVDPTLAATANPAAAPAPTLLQGDALPAATTASAPASAGIALPGLATAATAATAGTPAAADADALAALAAANLAGQAKLADAGSDAAATPTGDSPAFVLPNLPHVSAASRTPDAGAVFNASPTPTPDLQGDGFDEAVGTRLTWLAEQKIGHAHIKITPNDLGPVEVHLQMDGDKVHASFTAAHVEVRQALEQSLPRLRDMLGEHGFQLAHADVGAQQQGQSDRGNGKSGLGGLDPAASDDATSVVVPASVLRARGLLDAYA